VPVDPDTPEASWRGGRVQVDVAAGVAAGGALGAPARYGVGLLVPTAPGGFPWGTFAVNLTGSFALSALVVLIVERLAEGTRLARYLRPVVGVGFLGAYTTYSTYAVEVDSTVRDRHPALAAGYAVATLVAGFAATYAGVLAGRALAE
jgi:fluoride exporter